MNLSAPNLQRTVPILPVADFAGSIAYYRDALGFRKNWEWGSPPDFGSVERDKIELFLSQASSASPKVTLSLFVRDVRLLFAEYRQNGAMVSMEPRRMEWDVIEMQVQDPDGHLLRFTQVLPDGELVVERTEIRPRIETRLAAVLEDLARETHRSVGEVIEEVLLHSFEPVPGQEGQASASPHTIETYELIERLKRKHDLAYDTHDSYRFAEKRE